MSQEFKAFCNSGYAVASDGIATDNFSDPDLWEYWVYRPTGTTACVIIDLKISGLF